MSEAYEVTIPLCPECGEDMQDTCQMSSDACAAIENGSVNGTHFCPKCKVFAFEDEVETRAEYRKMLHHTADGNDVLIEIRTSDSPDMEGATADWYAWENNQPVSVESYTGVDDTFADLMKDVDL